MKMFDASCFALYGTRAAVTPRQSLGQIMHMTRLMTLLFLCAAAFAGQAMAGERSRRADPPLLTSRSLPPPRENPNSNKLPQPEELEAKSQLSEDDAPEAPPPRRWSRFKRARSDSETKESPEEESPKTARSEKNGEKDPAKSEPDNATSGEEDRVYSTSEAMALLADSGPPPTPEAVEDYRTRLEGRLLERYNNTPEHGGKVAMVRVILSKPLETSIDGSMIRAEFDQLVYDHWGKRLPDLEKEYFVVTFGSGGVQQVRSDPSIRVGLDMEKTYSEKAPLAADPFKNIDDAEAFSPTPKAKMPDWWRPEFPESGR